MREEFRAIVIGSGQGGTPLARALAQSGWRTALVEREHVGGTCVNVGCTPTKTMVASARVAYLARRAADFGVRVRDVRVDLPQVVARKRAIVESFRRGSQRRLQSTDNLTLLLGQARFTGPRTVSVRLADGSFRELFGERVFINTGAVPDTPRLEGMEKVPVLDSSSIMELEELPRHLLILGGGYIGLEFGQMFRRFGSEVTVIHRGRHLLSREDEDISAAVAEILRQDGLRLVLESRPLRVERGDGQIRLTVSTPGGEETLTGSHLLAAVGRRPATADLGLEAAGVEVDPRGFVKVNERLETSAPGVYAMGDVKGGPAFTHISYDDFRILRTNLLQGGQATTAGRLVPYTVFIDPELGRVGLTEAEARERGYRVRVARLPMSGVARALEMDEKRGLMKAVVDADTGQILGCAILGVFGGEVMAVLQVAMMAGLPYTRLKEAIFAHPILAESLNNLFMAMDAKGAGVP
jgi:pyruvate/2-oxoglutarate dehydrogenase complex dihydrolipoamide dehydrogenase (E3) component